MKAQEIINAMLEALETARCVNAPLTEIRMHPDDYMELKASCSAPCLSAFEGGTKFNGIRLIQDYKADRLPRKDTQCK